jgi:ABC-type transport system involved in multi-copper enzyme maturation permease subunit
LLLETCVLLFILFGVKKTTVLLESINLFSFKFPLITINNLKTVEVLLLIVFNQSKLWILFIGLIGVSSFIGSHLRSPEIEMMLARPISRRRLLLSYYTAASLIFWICIFYLTGGIWLIIGWKTGIWHGGFLAGSVMLCIAYSACLPFLIWLIVWSRNTLFSILIFYIYCFISTGLEFRSAVLYPYWNNVLYYRLIDCFYYGLPQLDGMLADAANALRHPAVGQAFSTMPVHHFFFSLAVGICYLGFAVAVFQKGDY